MGRASNLPTCVSNVTVGLVIGGINPLGHISLWLSLIGIIFLFYEGGMIQNDIFGFDWDMQKAPERPLPSGQVGLLEAKVISSILLVTATAIVAWMFPQSLAWALLLLGAIFSYNWLHKKTSLAGPLMGVCRSSIYLLCASVAGANLTSKSVLIPVAVLFFYISVLTLVARFERAGHARLPAKMTPAAAAFPVLLFSPFGQVNLPMLFFVALFVVIAWATFSYFKVSLQGLGIGPFIGKMLAGISLLDAAIAATFGLLWVVLLSWACFGLTQWAHRRIAGT